MVRQLTFYFQCCSRATRLDRRFDVQMTQIQRPPLTRSPLEVHLRALAGLQLIVTPVSEGSDRLFNSTMLA